MTGDRAPAGVAGLIADNPGLADRLLHHHVPNTRGDCAACGNARSGRDRWPCSIHDVATAARRIVAERKAVHDAGDDGRHRRG